MATAFDEFLTILSDPGRDIPAERLSDISDLDSEQADHFRRVWQGLPAERRRTLIRALGEEAYAHMELDFERICRLALADADPDVRQAAIENLWECEDPGLAPPLLQALASDIAVKVRKAAAAGLGQFVFLGEVEQMRPELLYQIEEALLTATGSDVEPDVRRAALESLGYSSRDEVPGLITRAFESEDEKNVLSALVAMGRSANDAWAPQVQSQLNRPSPELRLAAVQAAGELELTATVPDLIELLDDASDKVRGAAIWSLGQLGGETAREVLGDLLESTENAEEAQLVQDALDNLAFVDGTRDILLFDFDEPERS